MVVDYHEEAQAHQNLIKVKEDLIFVLVESLEPPKVLHEDDGNDD